MTVQTPENAVESPAEVSAEPLPALPGATLRRLREAGGMTVGEVAQALKFGVRQIESLERDDYQTLQGTTFVRGFIRAYARLLKTPAEPLLALLDQTVPVRTTEIAEPTNMGEATPSPFLERHQRPVVGVLFLLVAAAIGAYLWTREEGETAEASHPAAEAAAVEVAPAPLPVVAPNAEPAAVVAPAPAPVPVPGPGEKQIVLEFSALSWVEIKDAGQRVVLTGEFPEGSRQVAIGRPPFQLWIGKASAVRVTYGEQRVDLQPYARDEVARLTLD